MNITLHVEAAALAESGIREGFVLVNAMNITASVFINNDERMDCIGIWNNWLQKLNSKNLTTITAMKITPTLI